MCKSNAQRGSFLFAQLTDDGLCHLSFRGENDKFNVQLSMVDVGRIIENLQSVQGAERQKLFEKTIQQADQISDLQQQINTY